MDEIDYSTVKLTRKIAFKMQCIPIKEDACDYLEAIVSVKTGEIRYRCSWCEGGGMRTCNYKEKLEKCMFDKYGNEKEIKS